MSFSVLTFYKFVAVGDSFRLKSEVAAVASALDVRGTMLIAPEGINATLSGRVEGMQEFLSWLRSDPRFADLSVKESPASGHPFKRLKVKVKPEIVTFGQPDVDPIKGAGTYVAPEDWNALIRSPDVLVLDTRNSYEYNIGTFERAVDPQTRSFKEFPEFVKSRLDPGKHRKVAMFCTGGIRCEKATAFMRQRGFAEVYHLEGGILKYLEVVPPEQSLWRGECFIFDERVALTHGVRQGHFALCDGCGTPVPRGDQAAVDLCKACQAASGPTGQHKI